MNIRASWQFLVLFLANIWLAVIVVTTTRTTYQFLRETMPGQAFPSFTDLTIHYAEIWPFLLVFFSFTGGILALCNWASDRQLSIILMAIVALDLFLVGMHLLGMTLPGVRLEQ